MIPFNRSFNGYHSIIQIVIQLYKDFEDEEKQQSTNKQLI